MTQSIKPQLQIYRYSSYITLSMRVSNGKQVNYCYIVIDQFSKSAVAIDPAWDMEFISRTIERYDCVLKAVLVTHHHYDHVNLADALSQKHDTPVFMNISEIEFYGLSENIRNIKPFSDEKVICFDGIRILPIITPGHTRGSTCYLIGDGLFTGDTLFIESCGFCIQPGASPYSMFYSLTRLRETISENVRIFAGHCYGKEPGERFAEVKQINPYLCIDDVDLFVKFRMSQTQYIIKD